MLVNRQGQVVNLPSNAVDSQRVELREVLEPSQHWPRGWATTETRAKFKQGQKK